VKPDRYTLINVLLLTLSVISAHLKRFERVRPILKAAISAGTKIVVPVGQMKLLRENGLSIALFGLFALSLAGQYFAGWNTYNQDQLAHHRPAVTAVEYLGVGHFWEALFENWESEFLQMGAYILLTVFLFQKGSSESKRVEAVERVDRVLPRRLQPKDAPWPVRHGGFLRTIYENSLSLAMVFLFLSSFVLHGVAGAAEYSDEQVRHGEDAVSTLEFMGTSTFWFESFQNWQSEFLSIGVLIVLSIFLRQRGSPESKPVDAPHSQTGKD
jgi:hypothetical protein